MSEEQRGPDEAAVRPSEDVGGYRVKLPAFEGPLDLLLHLVEQHDLDILDIPIGFIAEKYVEYLTLMQELNIDLASEYLVMAATLVHIKSKLLLPAVPEDQEEALSDEELDPRAELIRRLLEYQKYREAAQQLGERAVLGRDVFARGAPAPEAEGPVPLERLGLYQLLDAFQRVLGRAKKKLDHQIELDRLSVTERINQLYDLLKSRGRMVFEELFEGQSTRTELIVTFLALLEMTRLGMTRLEQADTLAPITIELTETAARPEPEPGLLGEDSLTPAEEPAMTSGVCPESARAAEPSCELARSLELEGQPPNEEAAGHHFTHADSDGSLEMAEEELNGQAPAAKGVCPDPTEPE
jgi:segregation and condensation protein A